MGLGNAFCDYCGEEETSLHVLRDCGLAMERVTCFGEMCGQQHAIVYGIGEIWNIIITNSCALLILCTIFCKECYASRVVNLVASQVRRSVSHIGWKPSDDGWIKLNTDGACKERRLNYAWRLGFHKVELNVDSVAVVKEG
ncbi:hypothetical protein A2U01_0028474, partial [Trifolium medium]|nr:hypothetical protein [Trifolium medium]